jgi:hypothetical protein
MTRTIVLGLLGLVLAVAVGFGVHLVTRSTIALPVVQLEPPRAPVTTAETTTERTTTEGDEPATAGPPVSTEDRETETDDDSGRGRGRGRSGGDGGGGDNSGPGGGGGDDD